MTMTQTAERPAAGGAARWAEGVTVVALDADDTLWHNEDAFVDAHDRLRAVLAGHAAGVEVDALLAEVERRNLEVYGYGVKGFTLSMIETALALRPGDLPRGDLEALLGLGKAMLSRPVDLLPGVQETLAGLAGHYRLAVVTKGDLFAQEARLARSGLADAFEVVEIVSEKDEATYRRVLRRLGVPPEQLLMVGNSERSDIAPVLALGGWAAHVPYPVTWEHEVLAEPVRSDRRADLSRLDELLPLLGLPGADGVG